MKHKLETLPFFLITIPAFYFLNSNNYYFGLLDWSLIHSELLFHIFSPFILYILFRMATGSWRKAGILTGWMLVVFYFFPPFKELLRTVPFVNIFAQYKVILPLLFAACIFSIFFLRRTKYPFIRHHRFLNILFIALVIFESAVGVHYSVSERVEAHDLGDRSKQLSKNFTRCDTCELPDIYFFIFDEYTSDTIIRQELNYSNIPFISYLRDRGFYVADHSRSNYNYTHLSLASELNLEYLNGMDKRTRYYTLDYLRGGYTVYRNEWFSILNKQGYRIENLSIFDTEAKPTINIKPFQREFSAFLLDQTLFRRIDADIGWNFRKKNAQPPPGAEDIKIQNDDIKRIAETKAGVINVLRSPKDSPVFTYAHFLLPHSPYYYDSNGTRLSRSASLYALTKKNYIQQLVYTNKFIIKPLIDSIFTTSTRPFIIVMQGDHGYRNFPESKRLLEFHNLNAFYFHDRDYRQLYPQISSVNTFRVILNKYFNTRLPLLKDTSYYLRGNLER